MAGWSLVLVVGRGAIVGELADHGVVWGCAGGSVGRVRPGVADTSWARQHVI